MKCVHLDFHTGPWIEGIGAGFNKEEFAQTLKLVVVKPYFS